MYADTRRIIVNAWKQNRLAAIHVDAQNGFLDGHTFEAFEGIARSAHYMRSIGVPNIWVAFSSEFHTLYGKPTTVAEFTQSDTYTCDKISLLANPYDHETVILKSGAGCFDYDENALNNHLKAQNIDTLIIDGVYSHGCVLQTIKGGLMQEYNIVANMDGMDWVVSKHLRKHYYTSSVNTFLPENSDHADRRFRLSSEMEIQKIFESKQERLKNFISPFLQRLIPGVSSP
jgi:nicotinamidase-related amidase